MSWNLDFLKSGLVLNTERLYASYWGMAGEAVGEGDCSAGGETGSDRPVSIWLWIMTLNL